jgi:hypothetical protein
MKISFSLRMKSLALLFGLAAFTHAVRAQEVIAYEEALKIADKLSAVPTEASDQPFTIDVDRTKPVGLKGGDAGLVILPDKHLNADLLANLGKEIAPVAQVWTYRVNLANNGIAVENAKLRTITVGEGDKTKDIQLFLVGVTKTEQAGAELVVYGKGKEPVFRTPLTKGTGSTQGFPIEISGRQTGEGTAALTLTLAGQLTAELGAVKVGD